MTESLLARLSNSSYQENIGQSPFQSQVDALVSNFSNEIRNWQSLAAMSVGSLAFRMGKMGVLGLSSSEFIRPVAYLSGLSTEVAFFEFTHRGLLSLSSGNEAASRLFSWSGSGGLREGLAHSFVNFSTLKGFGSLAQGQNIITRHLLQDLGMVAGHHFSAWAQIENSPQGSFFEQILHAEITNLQMEAGLSLVHRMAPRLNAFERGLEISLQRPLIPRLPRFSFIDSAPALVTVGGGKFSHHQNYRPAFADFILQMTMNGDEGGNGGNQGGGSRPRPSSIPTAALGGRRLPRMTPDSADMPGIPPIIPAEARDPEGDADTLERPVTLTQRTVPVDVHQLPPEETGLLLGQMIAEQYQVLDYLGSGGFGHVVKVWDTLLSRPAVLKIPRPEHNTRKALSRFQNEYRITANLDPRGVVGVYGLTRLPNGVEVPVMEWVPGSDLSDCLEGSTLSLEQRLEIFIRVCDAVESAHRRGIIHRDLKPSNIRLSDTGEVKVMDWGISKAIQEIATETRTPFSPATLREGLNQDLTEAESKMGTPGWIAPEQFQAQYSGNPRSFDIFSLGTLLYRLSTGEHPFTYACTSPEQRIFSTHPDFFMEPRRFREVLKDAMNPILDQVERVALRAIEKDPAHRFQTVAELRNALMLVWARADLNQLNHLKQQRAEKEESLLSAWNEYRMDQPISPDLEERMVDSLADLRALREDFHQEAENLVLRLAQLNAREPIPEARKLIAEISWMRLIDGGDLLSKKVQQTLMERIRTFDCETEDDPKATLKLALESSIPLSLNLLQQNQPVPTGARIQVIPIHEEKEGYFREGPSQFSGTIDEFSQKSIFKAGYYVLEIDHPDYEFMRVPIEITRQSIRHSLRWETSVDLSLEMIPRNRIPEDFAPVQGTKGYIGHDIYRYNDPSFVISQPQRRHPVATFAASNPIRIGKYRLFIQDQLNLLNQKIEASEWEAAFHLAEEIRRQIPRDQPRVSRRAAGENPNWQRLVEQSFEGIRLHWHIRQTGEGNALRFSLIDPNTHPSLRGDPIFDAQPVHAISFQAAEAYTAWRSARDGRNYQIISAEQKEIIARNSFQWTFPWGYPYRRTFSASRLVHRNLAQDSYAHAIGTHPLGAQEYRDYSIYGFRNSDGTFQRLEDLTGNVREFTRTRAETNAVVMSGGSVRTPAGNYPLPSSRTYVPDDIADEYNGGFRLVLEDF